MYVYLTVCNARKKTPQSMSTKLVINISTRPIIDALILQHPMIRVVCEATGRKFSEGSEAICRSEGILSMRFFLFDYL